MMTTSHPEVHQLQPLTSSEQRILEYLAQGLSDKEIADILVLAPITIRGYNQRIYDKLGLEKPYRTRLWAVHNARQLCLLPADGEMPEVGDNPYRGLDAFEQEDASVFFGREEFTRQLLARLSDNGNTPRFLGVVGPSGSGKSSIVRAGLIPTLKKKAMSGDVRWIIADMYPRGNPFHELEVALRQIAVKSQGEILELLQRDAYGLARIAPLILSENQTLLLLIDQFEEIFTLVEDKAVARAFMDLIYAAVTDPRSSVNVVITLRADFLDRPLMYPDFSWLVQERIALVVPLTAVEIERAIRLPAEQAHVEIEPSVVAQIVAEASSEPGALPLMQFALTELFDQRVGRTITLDTYRSVGGTLGALVTHAESVYESLSETQQEATRQVFLKLVTLGEGTEDVRRRVRRQELKTVSEDQTDVEYVIELLTANRLLTSGLNREQRATVEVAHEALIREWPRLQAWLDESRNDVRTERMLAVAARDWNLSGQDDSYLLQGARLEQFEGWSKATDLALTQDESVFLNTSVMEQHKRQRRWRLIRNGAGITITFIAIVLAILVVWANNQRNQAENAHDAEVVARQEAESAEEEARRQASIGLAALAENESGKANAERGVLIALEALEYYPYTPQAQSALLNAIDSFLPVQILQTQTIQNSLIMAAWSPDGRYVAGSGLPIIVWDTKSGHEIAAFGYNADFEPCGKPSEPINTDYLAWSPSGESIAVTANHLELGNQYTCGIFVWNPTTGRHQLTIGGTERTGPIWSIDWSPDGSTLVAGDDDNIATLWDAQTGAKQQVFTGHTDRVCDVKFSPDGSLVATASADGSIRLWEVAGGSQLRVFDDHVGEVQSIHWSPDGTRLASVGSDALPRIWDVQSGEVVLVLPGHTDTIVNVDWSTDGTRLATQSLDGTVRLWDAVAGGLVLEIPNAGPPIFALKGYADFSPDGHQLLTTDTHLLGQLYLWDITSPVPLLFGHTNGGDYAAWSPDGQSIVTSSYDGTMRIWNPDTGQPIIIRDLGGHFGRWGDWSPDNSRIAIPYGSLDIFDAQTGETLAAIPQGRFGYLATDWAPDGSRIVTSTMGPEHPEQATYIIDADTYEVATTLQATDSCVEGWPQFSPDSSKIATGCTLIAPGERAPARIWDAQTGEELMSLESDHGWSLRTLWSPDGTRLLVTYEQGVAKIWNLETQEVELTYSGHLGSVSTAAWSPDGSLVASSDSTTKRVNIWDAQNGEELISFPVPSNINTISWSPDGEYVMFFGDSITEPIIKRVWHSTDELIAYAYECCVTRSLTPEERKQFGLPTRD